MKQLFLFVITLSVATSVLWFTPITPVTANDFDFETFVVNGVRYSRVLRYTGGATNVVIPPTLGGYPVREITNTQIQEDDGSGMIMSRDFGAFENTAVVSVIIPNTVTLIGTRAFANSALVEITIPDSVTRIFPRAFADCTNLTSVTLSNSLISIGSEAFLRCTNLTTIELPNTLTSISNNLFLWSGLSEIVIPDSITSIGRSAFFQTALSAITIPTSVESIDVDAFGELSDLVTIRFESAKPPVISRDSFRNTENISTVYVPMPSVALYRAVEALELFNIIGFGEPCDCGECDGMGNPPVPCDCGDIVNCERCYRQCECGGRLTIWETITVAGCETDGERRRSCNICEVAFNEVISARGHFLARPYNTVLVPTCTTLGVRSGICAYCSQPLEEQIEILEHILSWTTVVNATYESSGLQRGDCLHIGCNHTEYREIPQLTVFDNLIISEINIAENWIAITNPTDRALSAKGLFLTNGTNTWRLPAIITRPEPVSHATVRARGCGNTTTIIHKRMEASFNFVAGETYSLVDAAGNVLSTITA
jgi:hypothetical protein